MWPNGYDKLRLSNTDSTNAEAMRRAAELRGPLWIMADHQSAARGRRGRLWAMPKGNFAATLVMRPQGALGQSALRSFVAALALADATASATGTEAGLALKWPNDVLLNGGKMAGILLEAQDDVLAIGIGVNLIAVPDAAGLEPGALAPVSLLAETGRRITPETFLDHLAQAYALWEERFATFGFAPIRKAWLGRAARLGEPITARTARDTHIGTFETVDEQGALVLKTPKGREVISAADVFF